MSEVAGAILEFHEMVVAAIRESDKFPVSGLALLSTNVRPLHGAYVEKMLRYTLKDLRANRHHRFHSASSLSSSSFRDCGGCASTHDLAGTQKKGLLTIHQSETATWS